MTGRDEPSTDITSLLRQWSRGSQGALGRVMPLVYAELRRMAVRQLRREPAGEAVEPTDLVHMLFLRLVAQRHAAWENRAQFYAVAAEMMRRILVDHARTRLAAKRGGTAPPLGLEEAGADGLTPPRSLHLEDVLAIDQALERLARRDPDHVRLVELRFFAGLSIEETAAALGWSPATVKREWRLVRAWLFRELGKRA